MSLASSLEIVADYCQEYFECKDDVQKENLISKVKLLPMPFKNKIFDHLFENNLLSNHKNVTLWLACCIANIFRAYEWKRESLDPGLIKDILTALIKELDYLKHKSVNDPEFVVCLHVLETVANAKSFNMCLQLKDPIEIVNYLFQLMFIIINDKNSPLVQSSMVEVLGALLSEFEAVPNKILNLILKNIMESVKLSNPNAYNLAKQLIIRCVTTIKYPIENFLSTVMVRQEDDSDLAYENRCREFNEVKGELNEIYTSASISDITQEDYNLQSHKESETIHRKEFGSQHAEQTDCSSLSTRNLPNAFVEQGVAKTRKDFCKDDKAKDYYRLGGKENLAELSSMPYVTQETWQGALKFKTLSIPVTFYSINGRPDNVETLLNEEALPTITKRHSLDQARTTVLKMIKGCVAYEIFLSFPSRENSCKSSAKLNFSRLVKYLKQKESAAIVYLRKDVIPDPKVLSALCAFPPCIFSLVLCQKYCPSLERIPDYWEGKKDYLVVIAASYLENVFM